MIWIFNKDFKIIKEKINNLNKIQLLIKIIQENEDTPNYFFININFKSNKF